MSKIKDNMYTVLAFVLWPLLIPLMFYYFCLVACPAAAVLIIRDFHSKIAKRRRHERGVFDED